MPHRLTPTHVMPPRLHSLDALAHNLSWSWDRAARALFRSIDPTLWHLTRHNPVALLDRVVPERLAACADDPSFLARYDAVLERFRREMSSDATWFAMRYPAIRQRPVAYFCAEFGLHNSVPIYAGGLGILAGDHCKASSDLGIPLVGVGLLYTKGYFDQRLRLDGWQEDRDEPFVAAMTPLARVHVDGQPLVIDPIEVGGRAVRVAAWEVRVGRVTVYLLDTDLPDNAAEDRQLLHRLYAGSPRLRLTQEWILGVAGVRLLRALGYDPAAWHANEGHATFMFVERLRELVATGMAFDDALVQVREASIFTTHTPVPAGHDVFSREDIVQVIGPIWERLAIDERRFFELASAPDDDRSGFHMTAAAIRCAARINGVAARHGDVTRRIWRNLWPDRAQEDVPIGHVTNGVHLATWMADPLMDFLDARLGIHWEARLEPRALEEAFGDLDDTELWSVHLRMKQRLLDFIVEEARHRWRSQWKTAAQVAGAGTFLTQFPLTLGFARRFATYKRADLIFRDVDRLRTLLVDPWRPVQVIFAGKAHPADDAGKDILKRVYEFSRDPAFEGRVAFLEDYDMHVAHRLVEGVDLWLNLPTVPLEACGTSGMKAALNGIPQAGTVDGWWVEGFDGMNGWTIGIAHEDAGDAAVADQLYDLLERQIVPLYYDRDEADVPRGWVVRMKAAMITACSRFTADRMLREYAENYYAPSMEGAAAVV